MVKHANWSARSTFLLAAIGSAVGLGNIWKFPYMVGDNGGAAFVLIYLIAVVVIATPVLISEILVGRHAQLSTVNAVSFIARKSGASQYWRYFGYWGFLAMFLIMSFYSVIAGWILAYIPKLATGSLEGMNATQVSGLFDTLLANPVELAAWQGIFVIVTGLIVMRGVNDGIEKAVTVLMPTLFLMLILFVVYSAITADFIGAFRYLLNPDFSKLTPTVILGAIGQALFSLSVGFGAMMAYGAYLPKDVNIPRSALIISFSDTLVAIAAGFVIFPIVFANGLDPSEGPGLIFVSLSLSFGNMPAGTFFGTLFFLLLTFAALTTSIGLIEPVVAWAEEKWDVTRKMIVFVICLVAWLIGLATVFSFNIWSDVYLLGQFVTFAEKTPFDLIDYFVTYIMQPAGALLLVIFVGWKMSGDILRKELVSISNTMLNTGWLFSVRFIAPLIIVTLFILGIFY